MDNRQIVLEKLESLFARLSQRIDKLKKTDASYSVYRLIIFMTGIIGSLSLYFMVQMTLSKTVFIISMGLLIIVSLFHRRVIESIHKHELWLRIKESNIARIKLDWSKIPVSESPESKLTALETDLNLAGEHSLHLLLDITSSKQGSEMLRKWISDPKLSAEEIIERQNLIKELIPQVRFRERLTLSSMLSSTQAKDGDKLLLWGLKSSNPESIRPVIILLGLLGFINLLLIAGSISGIIPSFWAFTTIAYYSFYFFYQGMIKDLSEEADLIRKELGGLSRVFKCIEDKDFSAMPYLNRLCQPFHEKSRMPTLFLGKIKRIVNVLTFRNNPLLWLVIILIVPLDYLLVYRLEKLKKRISSILPEWLNVWYQLEAFSSLANFAYLNPDYSFPEILQGDNGRKTVFESANLGHPLIPADQRVNNSFELEKDNEIILITGSNMSGKSTFLRTLGINLALAYAGAPVCADRMKVQLFRVFTCIKVSDSVIDGISYFYAEVKRLKTLLTELGRNTKIPVFFLIDEIFKGTNNVERLIGSRSYIKALAGTNGTGAISTHDLELVKLAGKMPVISNYHFREEAVNNQMHFDYLLRRGPCPTTNALKIMKIEGLPVDNDDI
ncbi:MAG: MutS-related protein [Ignavibacteriales bacterium]